MNMSTDEHLAQLRRAIRDSNEQAWQDIYHQYRYSIQGWIYTYDTQKQLAQEDYADLVHETLLRFFRATTAGTSASTAEKSFDDIAAVHVYLKQCARSALSDTLRHRRRHVQQEESREAVEQRMILADPAALFAEEDAFRSLWQIVRGELQTEQERLVATRCWLEDMPPRELQHRYPVLFPSVLDVYRHRRSLQCRIQRRLTSRLSAQAPGVTAQHPLCQQIGAGNMVGMDAMCPGMPDAACLALPSGEEPGMREHIALRQESAGTVQHPKKRVGEVVSPSYHTRQTDTSRSMVLPTQPATVLFRREVCSQHVTYHQQVSYCGKARCRRCRDGIGHGPYWYAYHVRNGRTIRQYIGKSLPEDVRSVFTPQP